MLRAALFAVPVLLCAYALSPTLAVAVPAFVAVGAAYICVLSGLNTVVQLRAPAAARGRILSIYMMALGLVYPLGAVLQGWLADRHGIREVTVAGALVLLALCALTVAGATLDLHQPGRPGTDRPVSDVDGGRSPAVPRRRSATGRWTRLRPGRRRDRRRRGPDGRSRPRRPRPGRPVPCWPPAAGQGDRVAFCLGSSAALLCAVLGALRVGIVPVLLNATLTDDERDVLVDDADPTLVVTDEDALARLDSGPPAPLAAHPRCRPMHYTSGTTGRAKGVWTGLWDAPTAAGRPGRRGAAVGLRTRRRAPGVLPDVPLGVDPVRRGHPPGRAAPVWSSTTSTPERAAAALGGAYGPTPTTTFVAPAALTRLLALPDSADRFGALRLLVHAGSPCPPALKRAALERTGPGVVWEFYGSTEGQFTVCPPAEWLERPGTVGRARAGRVVTVDDDGIVWCRPPAFARFAYWRDEAKTAAAWRDGAFTVGDLGRLDDDGYLFLDGRRDDLVITGGVNVYPAEVEAALADVAGVEEVAVFGLPDERWGQRVCAAVVPVAGADAGRVLAELADHAAGHLAGYKRPKQYEVAAALPRTATGKVRRLQLPAELGLE